MRLLCITDEFPWPATTGYRLRLDQVVRGLAQAGPVDLVTIVDDSSTPRLPPSVPVCSLAVLHLPPSRRSIGGYARWVASRSPRTVAARPWSSVRDDLGRIVAGLDPAVVWWSHADVYSQAHRSVRAPAVVDLDNLQGRVLRDRRRVRRADLAITGHHAGPVTAVKDVLDRVDERRWGRVQRAVLASASVTVVCSDLDRRRLDAPGAAVVPNGYDPPDPLPARAPDDATFTMVGLFTYGPNLDAAHFFATRILPRVRETRPDACLRLVGRHDGALEPLVGPAVVATGEVPDVAVELTRATAVVAALRYGGGTRLKVLEAFAYGVPVVATTLGAEGLGAEHERELLLADDEETFATRCVQVLDDPAGARRRVDAARALWQEHFTGARIRALVADVARRAGTPGAADARR